MYFDWPVQDDIKVEIEFEDNVPSNVEDQTYSFVGVSYDTDGQVVYATYPRDYLPMLPMADIMMIDDEPFIIKSIRVTPSSLQVLVPDLNTNRFTLNEEGTYIAKASILNVGGIINVDAYTEPFTIVKTSSSKSYKAKDTNKTAEKISGSNKKGSKKTITPIEGKKVSDVIVKDKNGNKVDVTLNEDGTYSFIQPASDVSVEVVYKNREIVLKIDSTNAYVDNDLNILDVAPQIRNDRTMLPIRFVAENLGAKVEWDEKNPEYVLITKGDIKIEITLGSDKAKVNGKEFTLDSVAFAENERTYLPVRFVSEHLNAIVEWNEAKPMEVKIYER